MPVNPLAGEPPGRCTPWPVYPLASVPPGRCTPWPVYPLAGVSPSYLLLIPIGNCKLSVRIWNIFCNVL